MNINLGSEKSVDIFYNEYFGEFVFEFRFQGITQQTRRIPKRFILGFEKMAYSELDTILNREVANS